MFGQGTGGMYSRKILPGDIPADILDAVPTVLSSYEQNAGDKVAGAVEKRKHGEHR